MKELSTKQARMLLMFFVFVSKIIILPSIVCGQVDNDCLFVFLLLFLVDFVYILILLKINDGNTNLTIKQRIENRLGKTFANVFYFLIGLVLLLKLVMSFHEIYIFFYDVLYIDLMWATVLIPLFIYVLYVAKRSFRNHGRSLEMYGFLILTCVALSFFDGVKTVKVLNFFPVFTSGISNIFATSLNCCLWFGDFLILFFILGNVKTEKNFNKRIIGSYLFGVAITIAIVFAFYGEFGLVSPLKRVAIVDVTQHTPRLDASTSFVWVVTFLWPVAGNFEIGFLSFLLSQSFSNAFNIRQNKKIYVILSILLSVLLIMFATKFRISILLEYLTLYLKYGIFIIQYLLVFVVLVCLFPTKQKKKVAYVK